MLKFLNVINGLFVIVTIAVYMAGLLSIPILGGGISYQFFLGLYQIFFAIILLFGNYNRINAHSMHLMKLYWLAVVLVVPLLSLVTVTHEDITITVVLILIPMMIACYQVYAFNKIINNLSSYRQ